MNSNLTENEISLAIIQSLKGIKKVKFHELMDELQPYDWAKQYSHLPKKYKDKFLENLSIEQLADLMQELSKEEQLDVVEKIGAKKVTKVFDSMENDDLVSFLTHYEPEKIEELLSKMEEQEAIALRNMMNYQPETAGRLMNNRYVWIPKYYSVSEAVDKLKHFAEIAEYLNYLYVIDEEKKLVGVVSYRDLLLADPQEKIEEIMYSRVLKIDVYTDQEVAANLIRRYDFVTLPVVDKDDTLVGVISVDDVIDIIMQEANEDIEKLSASGKAIDFKTKPLVAAYRRLPWLILLLFIGLISGGIISRFEETLAAVVALAFFMPMIAGMTGNTGTQSLAVVVRGLASEEITIKQVIKLLLRELWVGIIIGVTCSIVIFTIAFFWQGSITLGLVVGISLLVTLIIGTLAGTIIPVILYKCKVDPAVASGPLITTINDILSLLIYFGIATALFPKLT